MKNMARAMTMTKKAVERSFCRKIMSAKAKTMSMGGARAVSGLSSFIAFF